MGHKDDQLTRVAFGVSEATDVARADARRLLEADTALHAEWIAGLAMNSAAPEEILRRVFTIDPLPDPQRWLAYRKLPPKTARAAVAHPDPQVRRIIAENPYLPPEASPCWPRIRTRKCNASRW